MTSVADLLRRGWWGIGTRCLGIPRTVQVDVPQPVMISCEVAMIVWTADSQAARTYVGHLLPQVYGRDI